MEIKYGKSKDNFDSNLNTIKALYKRTTYNAKSSYRSNKDDITELIYNKFKIKYCDSDSLLPIIKNYYNDLNGLISELDLSELQEEWDFIEFRDYETNEDAYKNYEALHGKNFYFIPYLYLYIVQMEEKSKSNNMILKMSYVYLHNIIDEFMLDTIELVAYLCLKSLGSKKQLPYDEIFSCNEIDEVFKKIVNKELNILGHGSLEDKFKFLLDRGIEINLSSVKKDDLILFGEKRNAITHSKGIVNEEIIKKLKDTVYKESFNVGDLFLFTEDDLNNWFDKIGVFANDLFNTVIEKFKDKLS